MKTYENTPNINQDQWLIRTAQNWIRGPYSKAEICDQIQSKQLSKQDEICIANQYWIYLYENEKVYQALGIQLIPEEREEDTVSQSCQTRVPIEMDCSKPIFPASLPLTPEKGVDPLLSAGDCTGTHEVLTTHEILCDSSLMQEENSLRPFKNRFFSIIQNLILWLSLGLIGVAIFLMIMRWQHLP